MEDNAAFAKKFSFPFPLLCDVDRTVAMLYGACDSADAPRAKRIAYLISPEGKIVEAHPNVDARSYPAEQLKTI